jgi:hypothetical protein
MTHEEHVWPALPLGDWRDTYDTLHMWTQIVGKIRLAQSPLVNHWWNVPLYVNARGLTTSLMPIGSRSFEIKLDFLAHELIIETSDGQRRAVALAPRSVADFYSEVMSQLRSLEIRVPIWTMPVEVEHPIPFERDVIHRSYDAEQVRRFFDVLVCAHRVFERFRARFTGKCSTVQFFWGGFDLVVSRFSGNNAPPHPPVANIATSIVREAYSREVCSAGFWPGGPPVDEPIFFSYVYPEPSGFASAELQPPAAHYDENLREYVVPYDAIRTADSPDDTLLDFLESTYAAAAELAQWDRAALERDRRDLAGKPRTGTVIPSRPGAH